MLFFLAFYMLYTMTLTLNGKLFRDCSNHFMILVNDYQLSLYNNSINQMVITFYTILIFVQYIVYMNSDD